MHTKTSSLSRRTPSISAPIEPLQHNLVSWDGEHDLENPKNWSKKRKWTASLIVSSFNFVTPMSSSMIAPAFSAIGHDLDITNSSELALTLSAYVLALAVGPLLLAPLSEIYGRIIVLLVANSIFAIFNTCCGFAQTGAQLVASRFLAGIGGSASISIGGGVLGDCWKNEERGHAMAIYVLAPIIGPAVGPILGGFVTEYISWRWVFRIISALDVVVLTAAYFLLSDESYAPRILYEKAKRLRRETNNKEFGTEHELPNETRWSRLGVNLIRPCKLLGTQIIIQVLSVYMSFIYGMLYIILSTFSALWTNVYHESESIGSLNYISIAIGLYFGSQLGAGMIDRLYTKLAVRNKEPGRPEFRVPLMFVGDALIASGLFIYGWTAEFKTHWIGPNIGAAIWSIGTMINIQCIQTYVTDAYQLFAASALGSIAVLRSIAGFGFPLFAPTLFKQLGYGWGMSLLGFAAIGISIPSSALLWFYGERMRARSTYASG